MTPMMRRMRLRVHLQPGAIVRVQQQRGRMFDGADGPQADSALSALRCETGCHDLSSRRVVPDAETVGRGRTGMSAAGLVSIHAAPASGQSGGMERRVDAIVQAADRPDGLGTGEQGLLDDVVRTSHRPPLSIPANPEPP